MSASRAASASAISRALRGHGKLIIQHDSSVSELAVCQQEREHAAIVCWDRVLGCKHFAVLAVGVGRETTPEGH